MTQSTLRRISRVFWLCLVAWLSVTSFAWACPNCKDALASDPTQAGLVRGIFWSILFLLSMPFLIFASLSGYFYWLIRQARAKAPAVMASGGRQPAGGPRDDPFMPAPSVRFDPCEASSIEECESLRV